MNARLHVLNGLLLAGLVVGSLVVFPDLPERIPAHFGVDGEVMRWEARSLARWFLVPLIALATVALTYGSAAVLPRRPHWINLPEKAAFLALPAARRAPVIARMQGFLYGISSGVLVVFGLVQWMLYRTALGAEPESYVALTLVVGILIGPLSLAVWLPGISGEIRRQTRAERGGSGG